MNINREKKSMGFDEAMLARCGAGLDRSRFNVCVTHEPSLM